MAICDEPHYTIASSDVATWLEAQGVDRWWTVDGDPLLMGQLSLPCPADELASALRRIHRSLLIRDKANRGSGERIEAMQLDELAVRFREENPSSHATNPGANDRYFLMSWEGDDNAWMLVEDEQTTEQEREDTISESM